MHIEPYACIYLICLLIQKLDSRSDSLRVEELHTIGVQDNLPGSNNYANILCPRNRFVCHLRFQVL